MKKKLAEQAHAKIEAELAKRENAIKEQLRGEFELRLREKIERHEADLKKKKLALETELEKKMKEVLK